MNQQHVEQAKAIIAELTPKKIDEAIATFVGSKSMDGVKIGDLTAKEFALLSKRVFRQLSDELESDRWRFLPQTLQGVSDHGNVTLTTEIVHIQNLIHFLESQNKNSQPLNNHINQAVPALYRLVSYQMAMGFWDRPETDRELPDISAITASKDSVDTLQAQVQQVLEESKKLKGELAEAKQALNDYRTAKETEFEQVTQNLEASNKQNSQLTQLLTTATKTNTELDGLKAAADKTIGQIDTLKTQQDQAKSQFEQQIKAEEAKLKKAIEEVLTPARKDQQGLTELRKEFEDYKTKFDDWNIKERLAELQELINTEAASQLFKTFDKRKNELKTPVKWWANTTIGVSIGVVVLSVLIFTNFFGFVDPIEGIDGWQSLMISSLKMVPAIILLYFVIRQYAKERAFQEEYAFRSAVALTVQSYANLIAGEKGEEIKNQLIADAVKDVYRSPKPMSWEGGNLFSFRTRDLTESVKSLTEIVKELKEVIPKR